MQFGTKGKLEGNLSGPYGATIDQFTGRIFVVDQYNNRISIFDSESGKYLSKLPTSTNDKNAQLTNPSGIAVNEMHGQIIVSDNGNSRIVVFNYETGEFLFSFGMNGKEDGKFKDIRSVAISSNGDLFIPDGGNSRIQIFKPSQIGN